MRRLLLIPKRLHPSRYDWLNLRGECVDYQCLYEMIRDKLGFEIIYTDVVGKFPSDTDAVLCIFRRPMVFLNDLNPRTKFIVTIGDIHGSHKEYLAGRMPVLERADIILNGSDIVFRETFPQVIDKFCWFPQFFRTHDRFAQLPYNKNPKKKCLMVGRADSSMYPLRLWLRKNLQSSAEAEEWRSVVDRLVHFWYERGKQKLYPWEIGPAAGNKYAKILNEYFCCVAFTGKMDYMLAKHIEIPAAGSLLLTDKVTDMTTAGFVPMKHYVEITGPTLLSQVKDCLAHSERYEGIRREGMKFVRANHSINNRLQQFEKILEKI